MTENEQRERKLALRTTRYEVQDTIYEVSIGFYGFSTNISYDVQNL